MLCHAMRREPMPIIEWNIGLLLGIPEVDKHHQHLVQMLNQAYDGFREGVEVSPAAIEEIMTASTQEFAYEEGLMAEGHYPNLARHKNEHVIFCRRLQELQNNLMQDKKVSIELVWF